MFVVAGVLVFVREALAAGGQIYITPPSSSVQQGNNIGVDVRINPGAATDTVTITVSYDPTKLKYVSTDYAGSPYNTQIGASTTSSSVNFTSTELGGTPVSSDSQIAHLTFTALAGSGSTSLSVSGNAANGGVPTKPDAVGATLNFTTPPPPTSGTGGGSGSGSSGGSGTPTPPPSTGGSGHASGGAPSNVGSTTTTQAHASGTPPAIVSQKVQYTQAVLSFTTKAPTQAYVRFGIGSQLTSTTPVSDYATTHTIAIDPSLLVPGQTYSYVVVSTDQQGAVSQSAVQHFTTKGLKITVGVFDKNHMPLRGQEVTLHSTPQTAKTDGQGFATFDNVAPGTHHVIYTAGKQTYDEPVAVADNVQTKNGAQTATTQNFSVVYGFEQSGLQIAGWVWALIAVVILGLLGLLAQTGRLGVSLQLRRGRPGAPLVSQPVVVNGISRGTMPAPAHSEPSGSKLVDERLGAIPAPDRPQPGSTIAPRPETPEQDNQKTTEDSK